MNFLANAISSVFLLYFWEDCMKTNHFVTCVQNMIIFSVNPLIYHPQEIFGCHCLHNSATTEVQVQAKQNWKTENQREVPILYIFACVISLILRMTLLVVLFLQRNGNRNLCVCGLIRSQDSSGPIKGILCSQSQPTTSHRLLRTCQTLRY